MPLVRVLDRRINARQVGMARILLGVSAIVEVPEAHEMARQLHTGVGIVRASEPWWPQLPPGADNAFALLWMLLAMAFCAGLFTRTMGGLLVIVMAYHIGRDQNLYLNHVYLLVLMIFLLLWADPGRGLSVDAHMGRRAEDSPYWPVWLIKVQMSIIYVTASANKLLDPYFMSGQVLLGGFYLGPLERLAGAGPAMAWTVVAWQLFLAVGLWIPRLRGIATTAGFVFHMVIWLTAPPSIYALALFEFANTVWVAYLLHLEAGRESMKLPAGLKRLRGWDWMGVFHPEPASGTADPAVARRALSVLPACYLWAAAVPNWFLRQKWPVSLSANTETH